MVRQAEGELDHIRWFGPALGSSDIEYSVFKTLRRYLLLRQCRRTWFRAAVLVAIVTGMPVLAQAELVTFSFEGFLSQIDAPLTSTWSPWQAFSGTYTFDSNEQNHGAPGAGFYKFAIRDFHATIGAAEVMHGIPGPSGASGGITIDNDSPHDSYAARINYATGPPLPESEFAPLGFTFNLVDSTGSALLNNSLTSVPPTLSAFQERTATFNFYRFDPLTGNTAFASAVGQVTGVAVVPLPAAAALFGSGLLGLAGYCGVRFRMRVMGQSSSVGS